MKFYDNSNKIKLSIFVLISYLLSYTSNKLKTTFEMNVSNNFSFLEKTQNSFLSLEEKNNKEMSEDMQFNDFMVKYEFLLKNTILNRMTLISNKKYN